MTGMLNQEKYRFSGAWSFRAAWKEALWGFFLCPEIFHAALAVELGRALSLTSPEAGRQRVCN